MKCYQLLEASLKANIDRYICQCDVELSTLQDTSTVAAELEYSVFDTTRHNSTYNAAIIRKITEIKKMTSSCELCPSLVASCKTLIKIDMDKDDGKNLVKLECNMGRKDQDLNDDRFFLGNLNGFRMAKEVLGKMNKDETTVLGTMKNEVTSSFGNGSFKDPVSECRTSSISECRTSSISECQSTRLTNNHANSVFTNASVCAGYYNESTSDSHTQSESSNTASNLSNSVISDNSVSNFDLSLSFSESMISDPPGEGAENKPTDFLIANSYLVSNRSSQFNNLRRLSAEAISGTVIPPLASSGDPTVGNKVVKDASKLQNVPLFSQSSVIDPPAAVIISKALSPMSSASPCSESDDNRLLIMLENDDADDDGGEKAIVLRTESDGLGGGGAGDGGLVSGGSTDDGSCDGHGGLVDGHFVSSSDGSAGGHGSSITSGSVDYGLASGGSTSGVSGDGSGCGGHGGSADGSGGSDSSGGQCSTDGNLMPSASGRVKKSVRISDIPQVTYFVREKTTADG